MPLTSGSQSMVGAPPRFEPPVVCRHWDTRKIGVVSTYKEIGVVDLPKTKAAWRAIGQKIRAGVAAKLA